jgi:hypothetical protein
LDKYLGLSNKEISLLMHARPMVKTAICLMIMQASIFAGKAFGQDDFEKTLAKKVDSLLAPDKMERKLNALLPDDALQNITTPSGWGGYGAYLFGGIGGVYPQVYSHKVDLIASGGFCYGDPFKAVNFAVSINMTDVHLFQDFSGNFAVSRVVFDGSSISIGGLQLLANKQQSDAPGESYYFAFSHAVQSLPSETPGCSMLTYTIGIGDGRFYLKSPDDIKAGRGKYGTAVFGSISYEVIQHVNLVAEWSGMNLAVSAGFRPFQIFNSPLAFGFGLTNLTRYSADRPGMIFTVGYPLSLKRQND